MLNILAAAVFILSIILFGVKVWHWHDTQIDWTIAKSKPGPISIYARGMMQLAWWRLIDGFFWLAIGSLTWYNRNLVTGPTDVRVAGRIITMILMFMELAKLLTDRKTRNEVLDATQHEINSGKESR